MFGKTATCWAMASLLCVSLVGCGSSEDSGPTIDATVSGKVTSGGQPVKEAIISFEKPGLGAWGTKLEADGTYKVELAAGEFTVTVVPIPPAISMNDSGKIPATPKRDDVPQAYRAASTSKAKTQINSGENTFDLDLK